MLPNFGWQHCQWHLAWSSAFLTVWSKFKNVRCLYSLIWNNLEIWWEKNVFGGNGSVALLWRNAKRNVNPGLRYFEQCLLACARLLANLHFRQSKAKLPLKMLPTKSLQHCQDQSSSAMILDVKSVELFIFHLVLCDAPNVKFCSWWRSVFYLLAKPFPSR